MHCRLSTEPSNLEMTHSLVTKKRNSDPWVLVRSIHLTVVHEQHRKIGSLRNTILCFQPETRYSPFWKGFWTYSICYWHYNNIFHIFWGLKVKERCIGKSRWSKNHQLFKFANIQSDFAEIAYRAPDPSHGFKYVRYVVQQHPYSLAAWNSYYKVVSRWLVRIHIVLYYVLQ